MVIAVQERVPIDGVVSAAIARRATAPCDRRHGSWRRRRRRLFAQISGIGMVIVGPTSSRPPHTHVMHDAPIMPFQAGFSNSNILAKYSSSSDKTIGFR